ncbi:MAG: hypothetical protein Q9166_007217 [cf. Caloplaca sp. 2 TL-2023]
MPTSTSAASTHTSESHFARILLSIHHLDTQKASSTPTPLTSRSTSTLSHLCISYIYKVRGRLSHAHYNRFCAILVSFKNPRTFEETRHELSVVFELANEYDLWEELVDLVFPAWKGKLEEVEQKRYIRMQKAGKGLPVS